MSYPNSQDYIAAVQHPTRAFRLPELQRSVFDVHPTFRIPFPASGNAAVVFKAAVDGAPTALRFFIREDVSTRERYTALDRHVDGTGLGDCVAHATWVDDAIVVKGRPWPMVRMDWVQGRTLDAHVGRLAEQGDVDALADLANRWRGLLGRLQKAEFAHGDLQHGNVLVDDAGRLRLVDLDGSWVEAFGGSAPSAETGHPNYQRTGREWGRWMDTFPGLVIYTALLVLSRRPEAFGERHTGENILFSGADFDPPFTTPTWNLLDGVPDPQVRSAADLVRAACTPGRLPDGPLDALLDGGPSVTVTGPPAPRHAPVYSASAVSPSAAWWAGGGAAHAGATAGVGPGAAPGHAPSGPWPAAAGAEPPQSFDGDPSRWYPPAAGPAVSSSGPAGPPPAPLPTPLPRPPGGPTARGRLRADELLALLLVVVLGTAAVSAVVVSDQGGNAPAAALVSALVAAVLMLLLLFRGRAR